MNLTLFTPKLGMDPRRLFGPQLQICSTSSGSYPAAEPQFRAKTHHLQFRCIDVNIWSDSSSSYTNYSSDKNKYRKDVARNR